MTRFALILFTLTLLSGAATAQTKYFTYVDTTLAGQIHAANAASAAAIARGFTGFTIAPDEMNRYQNRYVQFWMRGKTSGTLVATTSFTEDTVKFQGLLVQKTRNNKIDTLWEDIGLSYPIKGINVAAGTAEYRDTTVTTFTRAVISHTVSYRSPIMRLPNYYESYRAVNGKCDSGRVVIRWILEPYR